MKLLLQTALVATGATVLTLATTLPARADNGPVYSKALTPGHSVSGGSISADIFFSSSDHTKVTFANTFVNDVCDGNGNGDGNYAGGRAVIQYTDGTRWYGPLRLDKRTCGYAPLSLGDLPFDSTKRVDNAGVQGIVMNGLSTTSILSRGAIHWRDNQYTVPS